MKLYKIFLFSGLGLVAFVFFLQLLIVFQTKPKAAVEKVNVTYTPASTSVDPGENFNLGVSLQADNGKKISGADLSFKFGDILEYMSYSLVPNNYFDDELIEATTSATGETILRLALVAKKSEAELASAVTIAVNLKAKNQTGTTIFSLVKQNSQVVGPTEGNYFEINETNGPAAIGVGVPPPTVTFGPPITETQISITPGTINSLKLRFQGVTTKPVGGMNSIKAVVKVVGEGVKATSGAVTFTADDKAVWSNSVPIIFDKTIPAGDNYFIFIKGEKHIQKKICDNIPTETTGGSYHCTTGNISLANNLNNLDFSGIILLAGDLPQQDGVINSYDVTLVRNNLGKTDSDTLASADINKDGIVNTQDYSLIIFALSTKLDEE